MTVRRILIVDDDPIIRMDLKEMLLEEGYEIVGEGKNGEEALDLCQKHQPDLILLDVKMPKLNGIKAAKIIQQMFPGTAVLLLTAYSHKDLVQEAKKSGVTAYLVKPVSEEDLIPAIEIALNQRDLFQCLRKDIQSLKQTLDERKMIERAKGKIMHHLSLTEEEAYIWMREKSMSKRVSMAKLSKDILNQLEQVSS
ncbi:ANTAR domain-containing response regulator [Bacillus songklensis]|uniref:ANTAR domain-containing response regulator n=1 Tax=Bacillus songklensis TaxID=1069116 RepID=A0ABV8BAD3_9BACI